MKLGRGTQRVLKVPIFLLNYIVGTYIFFYIHKHLTTKDWAGKKENYGIKLRYNVPGVGEAEKGVY